VALVAFLTASAFGQELNIGVIGGTNLTDDVRSGRQIFPGETLPSGQTSTNTFIVEPGARRPIIGIQLEYRFSRNWALEFDVLHRELKSTTSVEVSPPIQFPDGRTVSILGPSTRLLTPWEFPLLAKYRMPLGKIAPFFSAGTSFRPAGTGTGLSHFGITTGGGIEFRTGGFRISPTVRYTRWAAGNSVAVGAPLRNQVELLVGLDRPSTSGVRAFGQRLSFGVIAGVGLGEDFRVGDFNPGRTSEANSGIFGALIEARLPRNLAVEINGLYRPLHGSNGEGGRSVRFAHLTWEFPVLLKYRLPGKTRFKPFVEGGPSFRAEGNLNLRSVSHLGATAGAGVETRFSWLKVAPMLRYTRWRDPEEGASQSRTWTNQTQLLVSFSF
jgi:hypothetical protein